MHTVSVLLQTGAVPLGGIAVAADNNQHRLVPFLLLSVAARVPAILAAAVGSEARIDCFQPEEHVCVGPAEQRADNDKD
jgi:hypothetical protein